jgi:hypothetical protein
MLGPVLVIILILLLIGAFPHWVQRGMGLLPDERGRVGIVDRGDIGIAG